LRLFIKAIYYHSLDIDTYKTEIYIMKSLPTGLKDKLPTLKGFQSEFNSAKSKKKLMELYAIEIKKQPKNKEKILDAYLKRLIEISKWT